LSGFALAFCVLLSGCRQDGFLNYPAGFREFAYVANRASNSVTVLDLVYMRVDRTLSVGVAPVAVASNPQRDEVYVVNRGAGSVSVIDVRDNHVRSTIAVHREPSAIAIDPSGRRAFVSNFGSNLVSVLDLDDGRELAAVASGEHPDGLALSPDGRTLVVANQGSGTVSIYNAAVLAAPHANAEQAKLVSPAGQFRRMQRRDRSGDSGRLFEGVCGLPWLESGAGALAGGAARKLECAAREPAPERSRAGRAGRRAQPAPHCGQAGWRRGLCCEYGF
jgi:YVTN family beta-propeller protein